MVIAEPCWGKQAQGREGASTSLLGKNTCMFSQATFLPDRVKLPNSLARVPFDNLLCPLTSPVYPDLGISPKISPTGKLLIILPRTSIHTSTLWDFSPVSKTS